jgi:hypothetical protein
MEIAKIIFLGIWLVSFGSIAYLYFRVYRKNPVPVTAVAVDPRVFTGLTIYSPWWWTGVVACFGVAFAVIRAWGGHPILWVLLAITELFPVALVIMFAILTAKLKQAMKRVQNMQQF